MNAWFGTDWGAPVCRRTPQVPVPVGELCLHCQEPIFTEDSGFVVPLHDASGVRATYYHLECWMRLVLGSTGHQLRLCPCFGGTYEGDSPEMSRREAARAAWELAQQRAQSSEA